jgi:hypothetical protein
MSGRARRNSKLNHRTLQALKAEEKPSGVSAPADERERRERERLLHEAREHERRIRQLEQELRVAVQNSRVAEIAFLEAELRRERVEFRDARGKLPSNCGP